MRPLSRPAAFAVILALVLALVPATTASAALPVPPSNTQLFAVDFIDANNGWAAGGFFVSGVNYAVIERTTDGGATWTRTTVRPPLGKIQGISFVSSTVGYAVDGEPDRVFKTLFAEVDGRLVVGIVPVSGQLDLKAVAAAFGGKTAAMADPADAERASGYVVGGISPVGQKRLHPTVLDESALALPTVFVSGGKRGLDLELAPADLVRATKATTARIART
jgi:Cys-tRNA(Pro)/Cys-tRNA(Cys) deacylase